MLIIPISPVIPDSRLALRFGILKIVTVPFYVDPHFAQPPGQLYSEHSARLKYEECQRRRSITLLSTL
jgi:hypothetical protein